MRNSLTKNLLILGAMVLTCFIIFTNSMNYQTKNADFGEPPLFAGTTLDGKGYALAEMRGQLVIVHFWASWCTPCVKEFPALVKLAQTYPDKVTVLAISVDQESAKIEQFIRSLPNAESIQSLTNFMLIHDQKKKIGSSLYHTTNYPESYIIDCNFRIREKVIGPEMDWVSRIKPWLEACTKPTTAE